MTDYETKQKREYPCKGPRAMRRRWFRFSLRTLIVVTVVSNGCANLCERLLQRVPEQRFANFPPDVACSFVPSDWGRQNQFTSPLIAAPISVHGNELQNRQAASTGITNHDEHIVLPHSSNLKKLRHENNATSELGYLEGTVIYAGKAPEIKYIGPVLKTTGKRIRDDSLKIRGENLALANIVVFLRSNPALLKDAAGLIAEAEKRPRIMTIHNAVCTPRIRCLLKGQPFLIDNRDSQDYALNVFQSRTPAKIVSAETMVQCEFDFKGTIPDSLDAENYPWLRGYVFITKHPFVSVSNSSGKFRIENIPPGKWELSMWHERTGTIDEVLIDAKPVKWHRGRLSVEVDRKGKSLNTIAIPEKLFAKW